MKRLFPKRDVNEDKRFELPSSEYLGVGHSLPFFWSLKLQAESSFPHSERYHVSLYLEDAIKLLLDARDERPLEFLSE